MFGLLRKKPKAQPYVHPIHKFTEICTEARKPSFTHGGKFRPLALSIETVNICNNDCVICPYSLQTRRRHAMPMEVFEKVVADYGAIGGGQVTLTPMVGEVFLDKRLAERLRILRPHRSVTRVSAISNATMAYLY